MLTKMASVGNVIWDPDGAAVGMRCEVWLGGDVVMGWAGCQCMEVWAQGGRVEGEHLCMAPV